MYVLTVKKDTPIDDNLLTFWGTTTETMSWEEYVKSLDVNIVSVEYHTHTIITFKKEEHISWFLLRWS